MKRKNNFFLIENGDSKSHVHVNMLEPLITHCFWTFVFHSPILFILEITIIAAEIRSEVKQHFHVAWRGDSTQGSRVPDSADMNSAYMRQLQSLCTFRLCNLHTKAVSDKQDMVNNKNQKKLKALNSTYFSKRSTPFMNNLLLS